MVQIKYIVFDNNGVLTTNNAENTDIVCAKYLGISPKKLRSVLMRFSNELDAGDISDIEYMRRTLKTLDREDIDAKRFSKMRLETYVSKPDVRAFAKKLSRKNKIALLSNFGLGFDYMNKNFWKLDKIFDKDKMFISCKLHLIKPNNDIFEYVLRKLKINPEEMIFIDDNKENVVAARKLGINAILFVGLSDLKKRLKKYNIAI